MRAGLEPANSCCKARILITQYDSLQGRRLLARALTRAAFACQLWQWAAAALLSIGSLFLPSILIRKAAHAPDYTSLALWPVTLLALISCTLSLKEDLVL